MVDPRELPNGDPIIVIWPVYGDEIDSEGFKVLDHYEDREGYVFRCWTLAQHAGVGGFKTHPMPYVHVERPDRIVQSSDGTEITWPQHPWYFSSLVHWSEHEPGWGSEHAYRYHDEPPQPAEWRSGFERRHESLEE